MIKVTEEGRDGIYIPEKESLIDFLLAYELDQIHSFLPGPFMMGCDRDKKSVIDDVKNADRLAVMTGDNLKHNMGHALAVIKDERLEIFDIGEITNNNLQVQ